MGRLAGTLKVCSVSLFFVPENTHEPVFRVLYSNTESIQRWAQAEAAHWGQLAKECANGVAGTRGRV